LFQENKEKLFVPTNMLCLSSMKITQWCHMATCWIL